MKIHFFIILLLFTCTGQTFAQPKVSVRRKGEHSINLSFTPQWSLNKVGSIQHSGTDRNQQVLYPKNTFGHTFDLEYQRITRYGLVFSIGLQTGAQRHDVGVHYNLGYVDEDLPRMRITTIDNRYAITVRNVALRVMAGYCWQAPFGAKNWSLLAKGGITMRHYTNRFKDFTRWMVGYPKDDTLFIIKPVGYDGAYFGSRTSFGSDFNYAFDLYLGVRKEVHLGFIRSLSAGIEATRIFHGGSGSVNQTLDKFDTYTGELISRGIYDYYSKDFALGVRITAGLWYR